MYYRVYDGTCQQNVNNRSEMDRRYNIWICVPFNNVNQKASLETMIFQIDTLNAQCTFVSLNNILRLCIYICYKLKVYAVCSTSITV